MTTSPPDGPPPPPTPPAVVLVPAARPTSGTAMTSLVLGLLGLLGGWCLFGIPCLLAIIFGHIGMARTRSGQLAGHGLAVAGLVLGYVLVLPMLAATLVLIVPADVAGFIHALFG